MASQQPLMRAQDTVATTYLGSIPQRNWRKWSNKIGSLTKANPHEAKPRYDVPADWHGGVIGEDVGEADASQPIVDANGTVIPDYEPRHQEEKAADWSNPPITEMALDIGKDYGPYGGSTYHAGTIRPEDRYPSVSTEETPANFRRSNYEPPT